MKLLLHENLTQNEIASNGIYLYICNIYQFFVTSNLRLSLISLKQVRTSFHLGSQPSASFERPICVKNCVKYI